MPHDKKTELVLESFLGPEDDSLRLILVGSIEEDFQEKLNYYINADKRINYLGWKRPHEIRELFCASDVLIQPGSLSNTFIDAICCGLPIILADTKQGQHLTSFNNGLLLNSISKESISDALNSILFQKTTIDFSMNARNAAKYFHFKNIAKISLED